MGKGVMKMGEGFMKFVLRIRINLYILGVTVSRLLPKIVVCRFEFDFQVSYTL